MDLQPPDLRKTFTTSTALASVTFLILFFVCLEYMDLSADAAQQVDQYYMWFIHVQVWLLFVKGTLATLELTHSLH